MNLAKCHPNITGLIAVVVVNAFALIWLLFAPLYENLSTMFFPQTIKLLFYCMKTVKTFICQFRRYHCVDHYFENHQTEAAYSVRRTSRLWAPEEEGEHGKQEPRENLRLWWDRCSCALRSAALGQFSAHFHIFVTNLSHKQQLHLSCIIWDKRCTIKRWREDAPILLTTGFILVSSLSPLWQRHVPPCVSWCHAAVCHTWCLAHKLRSTFRSGNVWALNREFLLACVLTIDKSSNVTCVTDKMLSTFSYIKSEAILYLRMIICV